MAWASPVVKLQSLDRQSENTPSPDFPDYSYVGYRAGQEAVPVAEVKAFVPAREGDMTVDIQAAIDYVSSLPLDENGLRGAVLLDAATYRLEGGLRLAASGVVLRGSGSGKQMTHLLGLGQDRTTVLRIAGKSDRRESRPMAISAEVAVGSMEVTVAGHAFQAGDQLRVNRRCLQEWIDEMDMNSFGGESSYIGWKPGDDRGRPGDVDIHWDRVVKAVKGDVLVLDAPITCAISLGEGNVTSYEWPGRIENCGVENISFESENFSYQQDGETYGEDTHRWIAVEMDHLRDAWVRQCRFEGFVMSSVFVAPGANRVTVANCESLVDDRDGQIDKTYLTMGGQSLFIHLKASGDARHFLAVGRCVPGPVAFVDCQLSGNADSYSGTIDAWSTGVLLDRIVTDGTLAMANRAQDNMGAGWTTGNSMMWNCQAAQILAVTPPTADNWVYGCLSETRRDKVDECVFGNATWVKLGEKTEPKSLYEDQLAKRQLKGQESDPVSFDNRTTQEMSTVWQSFRQEKKAYDGPKMGLTPAGVLARDGKILRGYSQGVVWWNGSLKDRYTYNAGIGLTRYAPGLVGNAFTDDLDELTDRMAASGRLITDHHYGLWYDRRRDDHERIARMDNCVWPPFYEQPFARSGQGYAWDGLTKYDLTKWNVWYWNRLKKYADLADEKGLILFHQNYFQHNIIEAGAHWADCPWRAANNINGTGFAEPVPYASDKRVYMAEQFYNINDEHLASLHRNYIRKCLDNFADNGSVIQFIGEEFTGPLHFVQFWLDVIAEWEAETGLHPLIGLSVTKDVQDAILADSKRAAVVDVIDIKYWRPTMTGFYAPQGGLSLAPRQFDRLRGDQFSVQAEVKATTMEERTYEVVSDYRSRFPDKAVICSSQGSSWAAFMGGASLTTVRGDFPEEFLKMATRLQPLTAADPTGCWVLGAPKIGYIAYGRNGTRIDLKSDRKSYKAQWLDQRTGQPKGEPFKVKGKRVFETEESGLLWLYR